MKVLSLSLTAIVLAFSSAVSASDFEEDKQYIACRKSASTDRQLIACQERLLERLNMSIAKALDFSQVCERSSQWCELRYSQVQTAH